MLKNLVKICDKRYHVSFKTNGVEAGILRESTCHPRNNMIVEMASKIRTWSIYIYSSSENIYNTAFCKEY